MKLWVQFVKKVNRKYRKGVQYLLFGVRRLIMKAFRWFLVGKLRNLSRERFKTDSGINPVMHFLGQMCTKRHKTPFVCCMNQVSSIRNWSVLPCAALLEFPHRCKLVQFFLYCCYTRSLLLLLQSSQVLLLSQLWEMQRQVPFRREKVMRSCRVGVVQNTAPNISVQVWLDKRKRLGRKHGYDY